MDVEIEAVESDDADDSEEVLELSRL